MHQHVVKGGELREIGITRVRPPAAPSGSSGTRTKLPVATIGIDKSW
jgi:hypothetical protein